MTLADITSRGRAPLRRDRVPGDGPTDAAGRPANAADSFVRFEFPFDADAASKPSNAGKCFSGHFDASCPWRLDDPRLAADAFDPDVGFARVHYVMSETSARVAQAAAGAGHATSTVGLFKTPSFAAERKKRQSTNRSEEPELLDALTKPEKYVQPIVEYPFDPETALERHLVRGRSKAGPEGRLRADATFLETRTKACLFEDVVDLEAFAKYVHELKPRCQHDLAPMLYLTQAVLGHVLNREMAFFSAEVRDLKNSLLRAKLVLEEAVRENQKSRAENVLDRWRAAAKRVAADVKGAHLENHEEYLLRLSDDRQAQIEDLTEQLAKANVKLEAMGEIREEARKARRDLTKAEAAVLATEKKHEERLKTLKSVAGQKDRAILELRQKLESLSDASDENKRLKELVDENAELKRRLSEGAGLTVADGAYEAYAESVRFSASDINMSVEEKRQRSARLKQLTPPEAARVVQTIPDWSEAGDVLRGTTVDFASEVLTCGVLDHAEIGAVLCHLSDMDGIVLFAMLRKTAHEHVVGPMRTVAPAVAAGWIVNAAEQAKKRLAIGDALGADAVAELARALGDDEAVLVLDAQPHELLAKVFESMYYADELGDAAELLRKLTGASRTGALLLMDEEVRAEYAAELDDARVLAEPSLEDASDETVVETVAARPTASTRETVSSSEAETDGANVSTTDETSETEKASFPAGRVATRTFVKPKHERDISENERVVNRMTVPPSWLLYCGCADATDATDVTDDSLQDDEKTKGTNASILRPEKLLKLWRREAYKTMRPSKLRAMVTRVYRDKMRDDARSLLIEKKHRVPLTEYVARWFDVSFTTRSVAQRKLAKFIFSLQKTYEANEDKRICQFVRLVGLYHPMPACMADLLLEAMEMTAACVSGPDAPFFAPAEFWTTWTSGRVIPLDPATQLEILTKAFPESDAEDAEAGDATARETTKAPPRRMTKSPLALLELLREETNEFPETTPDWVTLPNGHVSVSRFMEYILDVLVTTHLEWHDVVERAFIDAAGEDKVLDFAEFKKACAAMKPAAPPSEASFAFMYWRALTNKGTDVPRLFSFGEVLDAVRRGEEALYDLARDFVEAKGEKEEVSLTVLGCDARDGVASFLWHCGIVNQLGVRGDGSSALSDLRLQAQRRDATISKGSRSFVIDRRVATGSESGDANEEEARAAT